jgi:hypothetical protein
MKPFDHECKATKGRNIPMPMNKKYMSNAKKKDMKETKSTTAKKKMTKKSSKKSK